MAGYNAGSERRFERNVSPKPREVFERAAITGQMKYRAAECEISCGHTQRCTQSHTRLLPKAYARGVNDLL